MSCFVPSCKNSIGSPFPKEEYIKEKWLKSLNLHNLEVQANSFLCLDHFQETDLIQEGHSLARVKVGAVPVPFGNYGSKDILKVCRICMSEENLVKKIWEPLEGEISIMSSLMLCCYPVNISMSDNLSKEICQKCLDDLKVAHSLRLRCLVSITKIQTKQEASKRKLSQEILLEEVKKKARPAPIEGNPEFVEESIENIRKELDSNVLREFIKIKPPNVPPNSLENESIASRDEKSDLKELMMELTKDNKPMAVKQSSSLIGQKIRLPKSVLEKYASPIGKFSCLIRSGIQNTIFIEADSYLYVHGLIKANVRNLLCIIPTCKAQGSHVLIEADIYDDFIEVRTPHNHPPSSRDEHKKQMFFYVMRRRVQLDKTLNIKNLYDEFCKIEPTLEVLVPLRNVINEICRHQVAPTKFNANSFEIFFKEIETQNLYKLHFTISGQQFYQEKFAADDDSLAVIFANKDTLESLSHSNVMYVDASFKIDTNEDFKYQLLTVLLWVDNSYYPVLYGFINKKSREIFTQIFTYLHDVLAPNLRPNEIVTDYEANLYYALGETYSESHMGGSVFYYTQNLYKKVCSLNLSRDLETNSYFRSVYHMLLMLPLLPVNTIPDGFSNIELQAKELGVNELVKPIFEHVRTQWMENVTPNLFCVHCLENRINENVIAPFKKLRDFLLISKGKGNKQHITITQVVEKLIELEAFLGDLYTRQDKKSFARDLSSSQKKNVLRAWLFIETHPKININNFFGKVLGYIKCMENQLWIWGYYRYIADSNDVLISASNFSIINCIVSSEDDSMDDRKTEIIEEMCNPTSPSVDTSEHEFIQGDSGGATDDESMIIMEAVFDQDGKVVIQTNDGELGTYLSNSKVFV